MKNLYKLMSDNLFPIFIVAIVLGYFFPLTPTSNLKTLVVMFFGYMTFATGLATSFREFLKVARAPKMPLYILTIVHVATPIIAWIMGKLFFPDHPLIQIGYLITASIPVAVTSVIWTSIAHGNVPVALVTVTADTLITPALMPLILFIAVGVSVSIDYSKIIIDLLFMITLPSLVGMLLYDATDGKTLVFAHGLGGILSRIAYFGVIFLSAAFVAPTISWNPFIVKILLVTISIVIIGYSVGFLAAKLIRADRELMIAIVYNTGMRNIATGLVVAANYFPPETAIPISLALLLQQPVAALIAKSLR